MAGIWSDAAPDAWKPLLKKYHTAVKAHKNAKLKDLDDWYQNKLPSELSQRQPPYVSHAELVQLVDWKLTRGKWRPRLLDYAKQASPIVVEDTTGQALQALRGAGGLPSQSHIRKALDILTKLKGIGPATASAILAAADRSCPFMSDEALTVALGAREYTTKAYLALVDAMRAKAEELSSASGEEWSACDVELCLWSESHAVQDAAKDSSRGGGAPSKASNKRAPSAPATTGKRSKKAK